MYLEFKWDKSRSVFPSIFFYDKIECKEILTSRGKNLQDAFFKKNVRDHWFVNLKKVLTYLSFPLGWLVFYLELYDGKEMETALRRNLQDSFKNKMYSERIASRDHSLKKDVIFFIICMLWFIIPSIPDHLSAGHPHILFSLSGDGLKGGRISPRQRPCGISRLWVGQ
jgi:hypothetical protein